MAKILFLLMFFINLNAMSIHYIKMCVDPDWMPIESIDKNGKHIGIVADILHLIEIDTNFKFILVPTKTWGESLSFMKQNKCDILPLASKTEDREKWMDFTEQYINYPEAFITKSNLENKSLEELIKLPVGLMKGYAAVDWFKNKFPNINIVEVDSIDDAFTKIRNGEIYSFSDTLPILGYKLKKEGILDLKISYAFDKDVYSLNVGMAVRKGQDELVRELNNAISNLDEKQLNAIFHKWTGVDIEDIAFDYTLSYQVLIAVLLMIGLGLYHNYKLNILVEKKTKELKEFNATLKSQVEEKTKKVRHLLDNTGEGFLILNKALLIDDEYSKECEAMLGKEIAQKDISKILFNDTQGADKFRKRLSVIFNVQHKSAKSSIISLLPKELVVKEKILQLKYKVIDDTLMLILTDITEKKKLEQDIENEHITLNMVASIIKNDNLFFDVKSDFESYTNNISNCVDEDKSSLHNINEIYRTIHTFKGSFSQLIMHNTVSHLHNMESKISDILNDDEIINNKQLIDLLQNIKFETFMSVDLENATNILGKNFLDKDKFISIKKQALKILEVRFLLLASKYKGHDIHNMIEDISILSQQSLKSYLDRYVGLSLAISREMQKPIYDFEIIGDEHILLPDNFKNFINSLIHVFRNAIAHGIEDFKTRDSLGKNQASTISCSFTEKNNILRIIISDDGSGINVEKIKKKTGNKNLTNQEAYLCIFKNNFSTSDKIDRLSGRGVGLSSVKSELDLLDGDIKIHSEKNIGTRFVFSIPNFNSDEILEKGVANDRY